MRAGGHGINRLRHLLVNTVAPRNRDSNHNIVEESGNHMFLALIVTNARFE